MLRAEPIAPLSSSDLARAAETARIVLGERDVPLRLDPDWREMRFGAWEGLTWEQICAARPALDRDAATTVRTYAPEGGETFDELCARVRRAVDRAVADVSDDGVVLVATHAGPLHALLDHPPRRRRPRRAQGAVSDRVGDALSARRTAAGVWPA